VSEETPEFEPTTNSIPGELPDTANVSEETPELELVVDATVEPEAVILPIKAEEESLLDLSPPSSVSLTTDATEAEAPNEGLVRRRRRRSSAAENRTED